MQYTTREMNRRQLLGRFLIRKKMTHEEKQIHNAVHAELREFEEFKELVRQMREAQKALHDTTYKRLSETELCQLRAWAFEKAVDEYLKKK
jgi:hypothetical protein